MRPPGCRSSREGPRAPWFSCALAPWAPLCVLAAVSIAAGCSQDDPSESDASAPYPMLPPDCAPAAGLGLVGTVPDGGIVGDFDVPRIRAVGSTLYFPLYGPGNHPVIDSFDW